MLTCPHRLNGEGVSRPATRRTFPRNLSGVGGPFRFMPPVRTFGNEGT
jgi:hypothetical protein